MKSPAFRSAGWRATLMLLLAGLLWLPEARAADAKPPERMSYQGFLADANGVVLGNDSPRNYTAIFRIYSVATGGATLWTEQQTITVDKGYFSVLLGEGSSVGSEPRPVLSGVFTGSTASERFIGITVQGLATTDVEIAPRLQLLASPYSFLARNAVSLVNDAGQSFVNITSGTLPSVGISAAIQSTGSGGNARGGRAVDLQVFRDSNAPGQVASGEFSTISGGRRNTASNVNSTVGGGEINRATGLTSTISGGFNNQASATDSTIGGGVSNTASGEKSFIGGGSSNTASGPHATVGGGAGNTASGVESTVPGGLSNTASGLASFAAGRRAKATHNGAFVWADNTDTDYVSGGVNEFRVRATGGVKLSGTPARTLETARQLMVTDTELNAVNTGLSLGFHHAPGVYWSGVIQSLGNGTPNDLRLNPGGGTVVVGSGGLRVDGPIQGGGAIPIGGIIMWSGAINAIPAGWRLCDGGGGTPDLRDRFIMGAGNRGVGTTGGNEEVTLTIGQLPRHSHGYVDGFWAEHGGPDTSNGHVVGSRSGSDHDNGIYTRNRNTSDAGSSQPINILPRYYAMAFIMRIQ